MRQIWDLFARQAQFGYLGFNIILDRRVSGVFDIPQNSSWGLRKILNLISTVLPLLKFNLRSGCCVVLWHN